jgi:hypothetical protein
MKNFIHTKFDEYINEELKKTPSVYKFTKDQAGDREHNRLASKGKDGHSWKKEGTKKHGKASITKKYSCECGYRKEVDNDENQKVTVTYSRS